ncbi:MAG: HTTM domain-containing protein [Pirellulaceae bacterium]
MTTFTKHHAKLATSRWRETFAVDPRSLALFRILIALVLLYDLAGRAADLNAMYGQDGLLPIDSVQAYYRASGFAFNWSLHYLHGSLAFQASLFVLEAVFAVALLVGYRTRLANLGAWVLLASLHSRAPILVNGGDMLTSSLLLWGLFLPLGARWSLDVRAGRTRRLSQPVFSTASVAILVQVFLMYFCTGLSKFNSIWLSGEALQNALSFDMFVTPLGSWLLNYPGLLAVMTHLTLWGELLCPLLLFVPWGRPYPRAIALAFFALLHLGIEFTMTVAVFSVASLAGLTLFLPSEFWRSRVVAGVRRKVRQRLPRGLRRRRPLREPSWLAAQLARPWAIRTRDGLCLLLLVFVVAWNLTTTVWAQYENQVFLFAMRNPTESDEPPEGAPQPGALVQAAFGYSHGVAPLAEMLHLNQRWDMFSTPLQQNYRFVAQAKLRDGEQVDVLRDGQSVDLEHPERLRPVEPNVRWMLHYMGLTGPQYVWFAQDTAEYLRRQWNATHDQPHQIESLAVMMVRKRPYHDGYEKRTIAEVGAEPGSWILRHANGRISARGPIVHGKRQGHWTHWHEDGRLDGEGPYNDGEKHGQWTLWDDEEAAGFHKGAGEFVAGKMEGPWVYWHANGQKSAAGEYRRGEKEGEWTSWYDNGQKMQQGNYRSGKEDGKFTFWYRNGDKEGEGAFVQGRENGPWVIYDANGIETHLQYQDGQQVDIGIGSE